MKKIIKIISVIIKPLLTCEHNFKLIKSSDLITNNGIQFHRKDEYKCSICGKVEKRHIIYS